MSIISRTRKTEPEAAASSALAVVTKTPKGPGPALAAAPRANLLPPEIGQRNSARAARRLMVLGVVVVIIVAGAGVGGAVAYSLVAQANLSAAQSESTRLAAQQRTYSEVNDLQQRIALGRAAQAVGGSTDIDWQDYLQKLQSSLPAGVTISTLQVQSSNVTEVFQQSEQPLQGARIATISFTATTSQLPSIPDWLNSLSDLPGYVDAQPGSVTFTDGQYAVQVDLQIDKKAYTNRFALKEKKK